MDKPEQKNYPKGHFPVHITVDASHHTSDALQLLNRFIILMQKKYALAIISSPTGTPPHAEATLSVPFPDRENIRIDFNIFTSEMEDEHGTGLYFHMESAF